MWKNPHCSNVRNGLRLLRRQCLFPSLSYYVILFTLSLCDQFALPSSERMRMHSHPLSAGEWLCVSVVARSGVSPLDTPAARRHRAPALSAPLSTRTALRSLSSFHSNSPAYLLNDVLWPSF